jgi:uncharacterized membrane protein YkoI
MRGRFRKGLMGLAALAAFALGGSAVANAVSNNSSGNAGNASRSGQRMEEKALTGDTAAKVKEAALAKTGGGTIERVETDGNGNAAYEAHIVKTDGTRVTVYVDESFAVVGTEAGRGPGRSRGHARGTEKALTGDTAARVKAAALGKVAGATVDRLEADADGNAAYEAHVTKSDGSRATVYVDQNFNVVSVETGR